MLVQPPVTLDKINATPPAWRRVRLRGQFLHDQFFLVGPRSYHGMPHWRLVTPLRLAADEHVLIDRGWALYDRNTWGRKAISEPSCIVSVDGFVRYPRSPGPFVPDVVAPPSGREWIRLIPNVVGGHLRLEPVAPFEVAPQGNFDGSGYPILHAGENAGQQPSAIRHHLVCTGGVTRHPRIRLLAPFYVEQMTYSAAKPALHGVVLQKEDCLVGLTCSLSRRKILLPDRIPIGVTGIRGRS